MTKQTTEKKDELFKVKMMTQDEINKQKIEELKKNHEKIMKNQKRLSNNSGGIDNKLYDQARRFIKYDTST